jgi:hypothetical protein
MDMQPPPKDICSGATCCRLQWRPAARSAAGAAADGYLWQKKIDVQHHYFDGNNKGPLYQCRFTSEQPRFLVSHLVGNRAGLSKK